MSFDPTILTRAEDSGGAVSVIEMRVAPRWEGPPLHRHHFDEAFYVLEGELTFQQDDELRTAGPGDYVFAASGGAHTLANLTDAPARYLLVCTPAGFERSLARRVAEREGTAPPDWALGPVPDVEVLGPPIRAGRGAGGG